ncbi:MAG: reductive dehalogenase [Candidatus Heimdallarchaeota archaeon]|nr:reductive dehalogenase [Candidatus Heimdallarchaeota archaeon]
MSIHILTDICNPNTCNSECIKICPQNKKAKTAIEISKDKANVIKKNCINCLQCVYACPLDAIEATLTKGKRVNSASLKAKSSKKDIRSQKNVFEIDEEVFERYNEKKTIFNRRIWDESFEGFKKPIYGKASERAALGIDGYSEIEQAAMDASWSIENLVSMKEFHEERSKTLTEEEKENVEATKAKTDVKQVNYDVQETQQYKVEDPKEMTIWLKKITKFYGANLVGIAKLNPKWIYSKDRMERDYVIPEKIKYAIVLAVEMDLGAINTSPKMPSGIATGLGYSKIAFVRTLVSKFVTNLGYEAIPAGNTLGLSVPIAVEAGLGGFGRHGLLITRDYGPRVRIAKILTDLPLVADKPDYKFAKSVIKFCRTCKTCAEKCPSASIPFDDDPSYKTFSTSNNPGVKKWYVDVETCFLFWLENGGDCSTCISDCEYNHVPTLPHKFANWIVMNLPFLNPIWPFVGKLLGYGGNKSAKKFWKTVKV